MIDEPLTLQPPLLPWTNIVKPVIGMLHVPALPGAPQYAGNLRLVRDFVLRDAESLVAGGVHALMLENFGDVPFFPDRVPPTVIAHLTHLATEIRTRHDLPLGINVLRNDGLAALAVAQAVGASFIRVNVLCGARVTDQGIIQGCAHELLRARAAWQATGVQIMADVDVKHSAALAPRPLDEEVTETLHRGGADAIVVSGAATGSLTDVGQLEIAKRAAGSRAVLVGSGTTLESLAEYWPHADGFLVGTTFKSRLHANPPVDPQRVRQFLNRWYALQSSASTGQQQQQQQQQL